MIYPVQFRFHQVCSFQKVFFTHFPIKVQCSTVLDFYTINNHIPSRIQLQGTFFDDSHEISAHSDCGFRGFFFFFFKYSHGVYTKQNLSDKLALLSTFQWRKQILFSSWICRIHE